MSPPDSHDVVEMGWQDEEQSVIPSGGEDGTGYTSQSAQQPKGWKARLRSQLLFILVIFVLYNTLVRLVFWQHSRWVRASRWLQMFYTMDQSRSA